jgi:ribosomal protein S21
LCQIFQQDRVIYLYMLYVEVKNGNIEKALKVLKGKVIKTKQLTILREKQQHTKKSVIKRLQTSKAIYVQSKKNEDID